MHTCMNAYTHRHKLADRIVEVCTSQKFRKSHWCVPFTATFSKRRKIGALWSERCDVVPCPKQNYTCFACGLNDGRPFGRTIPECCTFTHKTDTNLQFNNSCIYTYLCQQIFATVYMGYVCFSQRHGILKPLHPELANNYISCTEGVCIVEHLVRQHPEYITTFLSSIPMSPFSYTHPNPVTPTHT